MKREIKFRALNDLKTRWVYGSLMNGYNWADFIIEDAGFEHRVRVDPESVGQFTGLKDKDGKEIYEGDILKTNNGIGSVIWDDAAFAIKSPGSEAVDWVHSSVYNTSVIIGNIHEPSPRN